MRLVSRSGLIAIAVVVGAIVAPAAQAVGLAAISSDPSAAAVQASADRIAAERAAASPSAPLDRFALIKVHKITPTTTSGVSGSSDPEGFDLGDAAIGAGVMAGLVLLGSAGVIAARRRRQPLHT
jgi:LPXTG-motif cell wall-anchored protein